MTLARKVRILTRNDKPSVVATFYCPSRTISSAALNREQGAFKRARRLKLRCGQLRKPAGIAPRQKSKHRAFELDFGESKIVELALIERQGRLFEAIGDTTLSAERRRVAASELLQIASLLGKNETVH